jgi:hypothetical protein
MHDQRDRFVTMLQKLLQLPLGRGGGETADVRGELQHVLHQETGSRRYTYVQYTLNPPEWGGGGIEKAGKKTELKVHLHRIF